MNTRRFRVIGILLLLIAVMIVSTGTGAFSKGKSKPDLPAGCKALVTAKQFQPFSIKVWRLIYWEREDGEPKPSTVKAQRHKLKCAAGPGHQEAMKKRWRKDKKAFYQHRAEVLLTISLEPYVCGDRRYALPCGITECESGFYFGHHSGAYGILDSTWNYYGGQAYGPYPGAASPRGQAIIARRVWNDYGEGAWECKSDGQPHPY